MSLPGLTGQSSTPGRSLLDRPVKPGDDSEVHVNPSEKRARRLTSDPNRSSLGLLPSGPDPVGEWLVHRQPPGPYIGGTAGDCKHKPTGIVEITRENRDVHMKI